MMLRKPSIVMLVIMFIAAIGCGGGSAGTGVGDGRRSFEGSVFDLARTPLAGVKVTVLETGDQALTDETGKFSLASASLGEQANFQLEFGRVDTTFSVDNLSLEPSTVELELILNTETNIVDVRHLEVSVQVRGTCDFYFENRRIIRQSNAITDGTRCSIRTEIRGDGKPLGNVPFIMERRECSNGAGWVPIGGARTLPNNNPAAGVGRLGFYFYNDEAHCLYRVLAPYNVVGATPVVYEIHTFRKQQYDQNEE